MNLKNILFFLLFVGLIVGCKSKKQTTYHPKPVQRKVEIKEKPPVISVDKKEESAAEIYYTTIEYIEKFKEAAMQEMRDYKIPASITLAQGIIESTSGNSELTRRSNNHFGIKCHKEWAGNRTYHDDDEKGECFRVYDNPMTSYKDHSYFLSSRSRYAKLFTLNPGDYVGWANGLSEAGYATDRRYPAKLIGLIEKFELYKYDTLVLGQEFKPISSSNNSNYTVLKGDTLYSISKKYNVSVADLKKLNDLNSNDIQIGQTLLIKK